MRAQAAALLRAPRAAGRGGAGWRCPLARHHAEPRSTSATRPGRGFERRRASRATSSRSVVPWHMPRLIGGSASCAAPSASTASLSLWWAPARPGPQWSAPAGPPRARSTGSHWGHWWAAGRAAVGTSPGRRVGVGKAREGASGAICSCRAAG